MSDQNYKKKLKLPSASATDKLLNELVELQKQNNREIKYLHAAVTRLLQHRYGWDVESTCKEVDWMATDNYFLTRQDEMDRDMNTHQFSLENYGYRQLENARLKLAGWDESQDPEEKEKVRLTSKHLLPIPEPVKLKELEAIIIEPFGLVKNKSDRRTKITNYLRSMITADKFNSEKGTIFKNIENYRTTRDPRSKAKRWPSGMIVQKNEINEILALLHLAQHDDAKDFSQPQWPWPPADKP